MFGPHFTVRASILGPQPDERKHPMATTYKTGGEVDAFCNKCKLALAHTILAMVGPKIVRVRCNTCMGEHMFRGAQATSATTKPAAARTKVTKDKESSPKVVMGFEEQLASKDVGAARPYSIKTTYKADDLIHHPTFGLGIVTSVRFDKVEVNFKMSQKTLIHGRGDAPAEKPQFSHSRLGAAGPADKPYVEGAEQPSAPVADENNAAE